MPCHCDTSANQCQALSVISSLISHVVSDSLSFSSNMQKVAARSKQSVIGDLVESIDSMLETVRLRLPVSCCAATWW